MWQGPPEYAYAPWGGATAPALYTVPTSSVLPEYTAITPIPTARTPCACRQLTHNTPRPLIERHIHCALPISD